MKYYYSFSSQDFSRQNEKLQIQSRTICSGKFTFVFCCAFRLSTELDDELLSSSWIMIYHISWDLWDSAL